MSEYVSIERDAAAARAAFEGAVRAGGVAVFPADGLYGLACDPANAAAIARIQALKGRDDGKPSAVMYFSPLAMRVLEQLRPLTAGSERVFGGVSEVNAERDWWGRVRARAMSAGVEHFTKHDLRHTCATGCAALGASESTVSRILGHKVVAGILAVTAIYDQYSRLPEMASALGAWAAHVERIVDNKSRRARLTLTSGRHLEARHSNVPTAVLAQRR